MIQRYLQKLFNKSNTRNNTKQVKIGPYELEAGEDHKLDTYLSLFPEYSQNFPRIAFQILQTKPDHSVIDIGANIGDSIALLRKYNVKNDVFCVEGDENYYNLLEKNSRQFSNVILLKYYLSDNESNKNYSIENRDGTGRIVEDPNSLVISNMVTLDSLSKIVDFGKTGIIKIDTDGFDCKIIKGGIDLIKKQKPVLFFEYDYDLSKKQNDVPFDTLMILKDNGYHGILYYDNFGRLIGITSLNDSSQLKALDRYIQNGKGAFPYYDVAVFHHDDDLLMNSIITSELGFQV